MAAVLRVDISVLHVQSHGAVGGVNVDVDVAITWRGVQLAIDV